MSKIFRNAYQSVEEAAAEVEHLLLEGYEADDITVVTYKENKGRIESLTIADVDPITQARHQSIWDRTRDVFTDGDLENPLGKYHLSPVITERYNKAIENGGYVILVEEPINTSDAFNSSGDSTDDDIDSIPIIGEYSAAHADIPASNKNKKLTVDGIPIKDSDGTFAGDHPIENPSIPMSPGTNQDKVSKE
ncbi:general stress protein [Carnobacterium funditum]|uniref:general stress protein n=1 Tax=Carnobacterium funditum TaxID=2752 RepID=UPI0006913472|nr:general stress protein [Carnobacterium funditum]